MGRLLVFCSLLTISLAGCPFSGKSIEEKKEVKEIADPATTTPNGCTCTSSCGATIDDLFMNDWCNTEVGCGEFSLLRQYWDYCLYKDSAQPDYSSMTWQEKQEFLWAKINEDNGFGGYHPEDAFTESLLTSFENEWDVMPNGRRKAIHSIGAICPFTIDIDANSPFTGLFKPGQRSGLLRLGGATDYVGGDFVPGIGVKFLRTGTKSANFVALNKLTPQVGSWDMFESTLSNHIPGTGLDTVTEILATRFCQTGHCITKVGLSDVCAYDQDGVEDPEPIFPFKVTFVPEDQGFSKDAPDSHETYQAQYDNIAVGTKLYTVKAHKTPEDVEGVVLGDLVTTDACASGSLFGDTKLSFQHQWIEEDVALRPEWSAGYLSDCYCNGN